VLEASDVILEVLDARDPVGCRCLAIEQFIQGKYPTKKIIVVLNKVDLVPREVVEAWLRHLRLELPAVAFKCSTQSQRQNLGQAASNALTPHAPTAECLGADTLLQLLKNYARNLDIKTSITVGIIGYPNVGKSSLINSLKRSKVVGVAASAGSTKSMQEIHLDKHIKLLDCPGIVFATEGSEADIALRNAVRVESLADPIAPVEAIVRRCRPEQLQQLYAIPAFSTPQEFLVHVAKKKGKLKKGGVPDYDATARTVLQDWNGGKIPFYTTPPAPAAGTHVSAAVVPSWGREFSLGEVMAAEARDVLAALPATAAGALQLASAQPVLDTGMAAEMMKPDDASIEDAEEVEAGDQDEAEDVEVDGAPRQPPGPRGTAALQRPRGQKLLAGAEAEANPQVNRDRKKALKQQKKLLRKGKVPAADADEDGEDGAEGDPMSYKFEEDY
jgi:nuclear GTP-binding protein